MTVSNELMSGGWGRPAAAAAAAAAAVAKAAAVAAATAAATATAARSARPACLPHPIGVVRTGLDRPDL